MTKNKNNEIEYYIKKKIIEGYVPKPKRREGLEESRPPKSKGNIK